MKNIFGWSVRNKLDKGSVFNRNSYAKIKPEEEWIVKKDTGKIPEIITEEDFLKVKEMWGNNINHKLNKGIYRGVSEFASKIYCGKCGGVYHKNVDKGRHYYNCSSKRKHGTEKCNNSNLYLIKINEIITPERYRDDLCMALGRYGRELSILSSKLINSLSVEDKNRVGILNEELEGISERKNRILNMYELSYINEKEFEQKIDPINKQIGDIEIQIRQHSKSNEEIIKDLKEVKKTIIEFRRYLLTLLRKTDKQFAKEHTREDIIRDIKKMITHEGGTIIIHYNSLDGFYELKEKYRELLNIYAKDDEADMITEIKNLVVIGNIYAEDSTFERDIKRITDEIEKHTKTKNKTSNMMKAI